MLVRVSQHWRRAVDNPHGALFVRLHKARLSKEAHCPGETAKIGVTYKPDGRRGAFDKTVTVVTNGGTAYLRIKGNVIP